MSSRRVFSVLGLFDSAEHLLKAIAEVKAKAPARLEAYSPYPIHGIDAALGLRKSPIAGMVLVMGILGALAGIGLELWTSGVDYPQVTAGKPAFSWEAFVPIMFETTVLFACFTAGLGMLLLLNRLPYFRHPMLQSGAMARITRDKFALAVERDGAEVDVDAVASLLKQAGAHTVEVIEAPQPPGPASPKFLLAALLSIAVAGAAAGYATYWAMKIFPAVAPMVHMLNQPRLDAQRPSGFFADGSGMRMPVPGTVSRGAVPYGIANQPSASGLVNPLPRTDAVLRRGRQAYRIYCSVCHGLLGNGAPTLTAAYGAKPANLASRGMIELSDGEAYHAVAAGKNTMPAYAADLDEEDRWAVIHYVRVLQRALNAKEQDIP